MNQNKENRKTDLWLGPTEQPPVGCWDSIDYITRNAKP